MDSVRLTPDNHRRLYQAPDKNHHANIHVTVEFMQNKDFQREQEQFS